MGLRALVSILAMLFLTAPVRAQDEEREGGIIGTGIVGTITKLGSIVVNDQHITFDEALPVNGAVPPITAARLQPGHIVAVIAQPRDTEWQARHIRQVLPLVGPIDAVGDTDITVLGTRVALGDLTTDFAVGDWVAVSGLWQDRYVRASRLEPVPKPNREARISGTYFGTDDEGRYVIGETLITGLRPQHLKPGDLVRAFGQPTANGIDVNRLETHLLDEAVNVIQVEGYLSPPQPNGLYTVIGSGLVTYTDQPEMIETQRKYIVCGSDGRLGATSRDAEALEPLLRRLGCAP